ncbi:MarR family winged helix-turn-helix transcriptional regulator [Marmoricola sp. RAF53]|uniref:MarR family winged helix-turn-helix transcriptional regulator n=1 Tax=Marmoricola sp. RAF53 TaxID=3233059 RepID=UPI003F94475F
MSTPRTPSPDFVPLIALVHRLNRELQQDMVDEAARQGFPSKSAYNYVFATLDADGSRAARMAEQAGITRQSMGEVIRDMAEAGLVEMVPDPADRRAKLVIWTEAGLAQGQRGFEHILELEERFSQEIGAEDYATARRVLSRLYQVLTEDRPPAGVSPLD